MQWLHRLQQLFTVRRRPRGRTHSK